MLLGSKPFRGWVSDWNDEWHSARSDEFLPRLGVHESISYPENSKKSSPPVGELSFFGISQHAKTSMSSLKGMGRKMLMTDCIRFGWYFQTFDVYITCVYHVSPFLGKIIACDQYFLHLGSLLLRPLSLCSSSCAFPAPLRCLQAGNLEIYIVASRVLVKNCLRNKWMDLGMPQFQVFSYSSACAAASHQNLPWNLFLCLPMLLLKRCSLKSSRTFRLCTLRLDSLSMALIPGHPWTSLAVRMVSTRLNFRLQRWCGQIP